MFLGQISNPFLTNKSSLSLTAHIVPVIVRPDPDTVLVVVPIVRSIEVPVCEAHRCPIHPCKGALIEEVCEADVSSVRVGQGGHGILFRLVLNGGKGPPKPDAGGESDQVVCRTRGKVETFVPNLRPVASTSG